MNSNFADIWRDIFSTIAVTDNKECKDIQGYFKVPTQFQMHATVSVGIRSTTVLYQIVAEIPKFYMVY